MFLLLSSTQSTNTRVERLSQPPLNVASVVHHCCIIRGPRIHRSCDFGETLESLRCREGPREGTHSPLTPTQGRKTNQTNDDTGWKKLTKLLLILVSAGSRDAGTNFRTVRCSVETVRLLENYSYPPAAWPHTNRSLRATCPYGRLIRPPGPTRLLDLYRSTYLPGLLPEDTLFQYISILNRACVNPNLGRRALVNVRNFQSDFFYAWLLTVASRGQVFLLRPWFPCCTRRRQTPRPYGR